MDALQTHAVSGGGGALRLENETRARAKESIEREFGERGGRQGEKTSMRRILSLGLAKQQRGQTVDIAKIQNVRQRR